MPGPNTTGLPNTADYNLGRGKVYFALLHPTTKKPLAWRDLGNSPEFNCSLEGETLDHQSSRSGLKSVDKQVSISLKASVTFSLDEFNHENLALFFQGDKATHTNVAVAGFAEFVMVPDTYLEKGRWYDIVNSSGNRAYDVDYTKLTVKTNEGSPVTLVKDTDYTVDAEMGRIFTLSTSTAIATAIAANKGLKVTLTADGTAAAVNEVRGVMNSGLTGALKFISSNPADSDSQQEYQFHQITIKANGDLSMIGDDWSKMQFTGAAEKNETGFSTSPTLTIRKVA